MIPNQDSRKKISFVSLHREFFGLHLEAVQKTSADDVVDDN